MQTIAPAELKALLADREQEVAFLDIREFGEYGMEHPFLSVNLPFSLLEARIHQLVPRTSTPVVLMDENDEGRARRVQERLGLLGYSRVQVLRDGISGWKAAGYGVFAGVNVVSKTFGELAHETFQTPSIPPETLVQWQREERKVHIVDGRPLSEYHKMNIPGASCCPNGELARRLSSLLAGDAMSPVVVNCAGRTRSIIGAQTLVWLGIDNPVYALENGTQGWRLAGLALEHGSVAEYPGKTALDSGLARAARRIAAEHRVAEIDAATLRDWHADPQRTTFLFDVRTQEEYRQATAPGALHAPGGQLIQATDHWIGVQRARVVLVDDDECRAPMVATWLKLMGLEVAWLKGGNAEWSQLPPASPSTVLETGLTPVALDEAMAGHYLRLDARPGMQYRAGHLPGAKWVNRSLLDSQLVGIDASCDIVLIGDAAQVACLAPDLEARGLPRPLWLEADEAQWQAAGYPLESTPDEPDDASCIDYLFFVHDRHDGNLEASRRYLAWETGLLAQLDEQERRTFAI